LIVALEEMNMRCRCTVLAIENITEQLRYEEQLEQALANAEKANLAKSQFLSQMSHELRCGLRADAAMCRMILGADWLHHNTYEMALRPLRTPLNGVIGMSSLIADMGVWPKPFSTERKFPTTGPVHFWGGEYFGHFCTVLGG
jgi:hypothetical protein